MIAIDFVQNERLPTVLVVEDEPLIRFAVADALRDFGVRVVEAATADQAWDFLAQGVEIDALLTDHRMPGELTGAQLAMRVRERFPTVEVILASAQPVCAGWSGPVLQKPYEMLRVCQKLASLATERHKRKF